MISSKLPYFLKNCSYICLPSTALGSIRQSSFRTSQFLVDIDEINRKFEVTKCPEDWKYVDRILPLSVVPTPKPKEKYVSDWKPQGENLSGQPYYIGRTRNHMTPVYLKITRHGTKRVTVLKKIQGDIWALDKHIREFLETGTVKPLRSQVNEFAGFIRYHGDHVNAIKEWLLQRNF